MNNIGGNDSNGVVNPPDSGDAFGEVNTNCSRFDELLLHLATTNKAEFIMETAAGTTTIPFNLFTNLCVKRFPKHLFLE